MDNRLRNNPTRPPELDALLNGLEGVTLGPWTVFSADEDYRIDTVDGFIAWEVEEVENAAHIARCDPDTIRKIGEYVAALEAENERLKSA